jgi:prolyl 4-hydroxylase
MQAITQLSDDWRTWITHNLARGCDPDALIADMVRDRFDPDFARSAVLVLTGQRSAATAREPFIYETPRLAAGNLIHADDRDMRVIMRAERPCIAVIENILSDEECDELVRRSADKLKRSTIVDPASGSFAVIAERSSDGTFFPLEDDAFIARIDRRIAALMNAPVANGEGLQILHYRTGGQYTPHFDYFPLDDPGSAAHVSTGGQRIATLVMYLNDVDDGGATVFPELKLTVGPKKGAGVYFEYCNSRGQVDPLTLHGGMPVLAGEKWIATKWLRQRRYG